MTLSLVLLFLQLFGLAQQSSAASPSSSQLPEFPPCDPVSELLKPVVPGEPPLHFCAKWNPEYLRNGRQCCGPLHTGHRGKRRARCSPRRAKASYCDEMTDEQRAYSEAAASGKLGDLLNYITLEMGRRGDQAYCTTGNGFLAHGRRVVPTIKNRIIVQSPEKCLNFGTDAMAGMMEWLGREIASKYSAEHHSGVNLILGDISAPRGGCLSNPNGKRRHASHTAGQDADVGFLTVKRGQTSPTKFHRDFDAATNWWFIKKIFRNPFACIKVIFLDQKHIRTLTKYAQGDSDWRSYHRFIRHMPGHKNHLHIRIGNGPGSPGCTPNARPELEYEEDSDTIEANELAIIDELKTRQSSSVQE